MDEYTEDLYGYQVVVNKVGGGTMGHYYTNEDWEVSVWRGMECLFEEEIIHIGSRATHSDAAQKAAEFADWKYGE